jgi:cytochrome c-type biogenesis protein CcsB
MSNSFLGISLLLYLLATAAFIVHLIRQTETPRQAAVGLLAGAFAFHLASLAVGTLVLGYQLLAPFPEGLSFIACIMVGVYLIVAPRRNLTVVGALVAPLAFLFSFSAYGAGELPERLQSVWLPAHVAPVFVGYAILAVAFCLSLTYLFQERQLKGKRRGGLFRHLPSLETLDTLNYRFLTWGFALFSIGLITGSLLARQAWGALWSWEPVQVWSGVTWLLYAALLQARVIGWRGRTAAALTVVGFVVLIVSFLGVNIVAPGKHGGAVG